ncbi:hypothetical protein C8F01DRAFT_1261216 [Mycena amicta]|nr:hypothetical protein C8F01DRAFT_1091857 [Mycena amicta]KAJ7053040.1 hypothetical protein C8F01DRAFT_1261216 [Mycena amicta]
MQHRPEAARSSSILTLHLVLCLGRHCCLLCALGNNSDILCLYDSQANSASVDTTIDGEEERTAVQFAKTNKRAPTDAGTITIRYVCGRSGTGGKKPYTKKHPERKHKKDPKVIDCPVSFSIKIYNNSLCILGWLHNRTHNHETGNANLPFTRIPKALQEVIAGHVRNGLSSAVILRKIQAEAYDPYLGCKSSNATRKDLILPSDIYSIRKRIEAELVRLNPDDGKSVLLWVEKLR